MCRTQCLTSGVVLGFVGDRRLVHPVNSTGSVGGTFCFTDEETALQGGHSRLSLQLVIW
jgi:hypothetical protein